MTPLRLPWYRDHLFMVHDKRAPAVFKCCRTERPDRWRGDMPCPCGEVIWDPSTYPWPPTEWTADELEFRAIIDFSPERLAAAMGVTELRETDSLPPLDDLDEGTQCCGTHYETFAAFMTHQRQDHAMKSG